MYRKAHDPSILFVAAKIFDTLGDGAVAKGDKSKKIKK